MSKAKTLSEKEFNKLLKYLHTTNHSERNKLMIYFSFWAGMRVKEIASLKIKDVFNNDGSVKREIKLTSEQTKGNKNITFEELSSFCEDKLSRYKIPKDIKVIDSLPKNATGKILKRELRKIN